MSTGNERVWPVLMTTGRVLAASLPDVSFPYKIPHMLTLQELLDPVEAEWIAQSRFLRPRRTVALTSDVRGIPGIGNDAPGRLATIHLFDGVQERVVQGFRLERIFPLFIELGRRHIVIRGRQD